MRVLVTGGRDFHDAHLIFKTLDALRNRPEGVTVIIQGGCPTGADRWANEWAKHHGVLVRTYRADWRLHGRAAGPIRNRHMVEHSRPDLVVAFPGGRGTADCVSCARQQGVHVVQIPEAGIDLFLLDKDLRKLDREKSLL